MEINLVRNEVEYNKALIEIDKLLDCREGSIEAEKLELLSILVENYEDKHYKIETPDPIEAINFRMEQLGLSRRDLEQSIGTRSRVSEVMNKKRKLTLAMIRKLHKNLNIPADILIKELEKKSA